MSKSDPLPWRPQPRDELRIMRTMTVRESGLFARLMLVFWDHGPQLKERLASLCGVHPNQFKADWPGMEPHLIRINGCWTAQSVEDARTHAAARQEQARDAAGRRWGATQGVIPGVTGGVTPGVETPKTAEIRHFSDADAYASQSQNNKKYKDTSSPCAAGAPEGVVDEVANLAAQRTTGRPVDGIDVVEGSSAAAEQEQVTTGRLGVVQESNTASASAVVQFPAPPQSALPLDATPATSKPALLWTEGLHTLAQLTGKPAAACRGQLGGLRKAAGNDDARLLNVIRAAQQEQPANPYPWILARLTSVPAATVQGDDPADAWGIEAYCKAKEFRPTTDPTDRRMGKWLASGWVIDRVLNKIAEAARLPVLWRGDWNVALSWIEQRIEPDDICRAIERFAGWDQYDRTNVKSLRLFDRAVRERAGNGRRTA